VREAAPSGRPLFFVPGPQSITHHHSPLDDFRERVLPRGSDIDAIMEMRATEEMVPASLT